MPVFPEARPRDAEALFQQRVLAVLRGPGQVVPEVRVYETPASFSDVVDFYEDYVEGNRMSVENFTVDSRMRSLAEQTRQGSGQPLALGRLLFEAEGRGTAAPMPAEMVVDSLSTRRGVDSLLASAPGDSLLPAAGAEALREPSAEGELDSIVDGLERPAGPAELTPGEVADSLTALADRLAGVQGVRAFGTVRLKRTPAAEALVSIERPHLNPRTLRVDSLTVVNVVVQPSVAAVR